MARAGLNCHQREKCFCRSSPLLSGSTGTYLRRRGPEPLARLEGTLSPWVAYPRSFFADTVRTNRIGLGNQQERVAAERGDAG